MTKSKYCLVICEGGGKTTLFQENPHEYLDIDHFIWQDPVRKSRLEKILADRKLEYIGQLYQEVMESNETLGNDPRIILVHRPENAEWLDREILGIYCPSKELHEKNIKNRLPHLQDLARNDWSSLDSYNPIEYDSFPLVVK